MFRGFTEQNHIGFTFQAQTFVTNLQEHSCGEEESSCNTHKRGKTDISVENCTKSICETFTSWTCMDCMVCGLMSDPDINEEKEKTIQRLQMTDLLREGRKIDVNAKEKTVIAIDGISDSQ